ncbi:hypothetical protein C8J56DRAFT_1170738 [Mycena floridula]|nr:hypothetical protein C8J56DRAFT_1170738 [Mycena floridula]
MSILAQELLDHTVDFLRDSPGALAACALSSKSLLERARGHLYWEIDVSGFQPGTWAGSWWWSHFHLISYVRSLKISGCPPQGFDPIPIEFWNAMPRNLYQIQVASFPWPELPPHVQNFLLKVDAKQVIIEHIQKLPRSYVCTFPSCITLQFTTARLCFGEETLPEPSNVAKIAPTELRVHVPDPGIWSSHPLIDLSAVESLQFQIRGSIYETQDFDLIRATSPKLKHLKFTVPEQTPELLNSSALDLRCFTRLETLVLHWNCSPETAKSLEAFISSFPPNHSLQTITIIAFPFRHRNEDERLIDRFGLLDWTHLDGILGEANRSGHLGLVRVRLVYATGNPGREREPKMKQVAQWLCSEKLSGLRRRGILQVDIWIVGTPMETYLAPN